MFNKKNTIPIFFAVDDAYIPFLAVAIYSLVKHANKENEYIINIDSGDIVKIMWWKSMNTMEPLCKEKVLENF